MDHRDTNSVLPFASPSGIAAPPVDYTVDLPDEILSFIFQFLPPPDRTRVSLVSHRFLLLESQSRTRLSLKALADLTPHLPSIFSRFNSVTKLSLRCERRSVSIDDAALESISAQCSNLTRIKLRACREITSVGVSGFAQNCRNLKKFSCSLCAFGITGINALLRSSPFLEELSVKHLRDNHGVDKDGPMIIPGLAADSLKTISLKELHNGQCFERVITTSKNLKTVKLFRCLGDWDDLFRKLARNYDQKSSKLVELHLERVHVTDIGLSALSSCCSLLEILHLAKTADCTSLGVISIAEKCRGLRKLYIDGWGINKIGDEGLLAVAKHCSKLQELVLISVNATTASLMPIAENCKDLERLALCGSETVCDAEISGMAEKCVALRNLCIKGCGISNHGMEALAWGFPNLVKVKVKKCRGVGTEIVEWLHTYRPSLIVNLDVGETEVAEASESDAGVHEAEDVEIPPPLGTREVVDTPKSKFILSTVRNFVAFTFRRWSNGSSSSSSDNY